MMEYKIVNLVANTDLGITLDLFKLNLELSNCEYDPEIYYALIYRLNKPKLSILVNKSGKIIFVGGKSIRDIEIARDIFHNDLIYIGYKPIKKEILFQNNVINAKLDYKPKIEKIAIENENIEYAPEVFPALIFRSFNPKFTCLIFKNGNIIITGLKKIDNIESVLRKVNKICERE